MCDALTGLPKSLGRLTALKTLDLHACAELTNLPESLGQLESLTKLNLRWCNDFMRLPLSAAFLSSNCVIFSHDTIFPPTNVMKQGMQAIKEFLFLRNYHFKMLLFIKVFRLPLELTELICGEFF